MPQGVNEPKRPLLKPQIDLDDAAEFEAIHKKAFRIAFDYLHKCFPPRREDEYWKNALALIQKAVSENPGNLAVPQLMLGVYNYLSEIVKDLPEEETT